MGVALTIDPTAAALACALFYGTSTFLGGRAAVHLGATKAVGIFQSTGFILALTLLALTGLGSLADLPSSSDLLLAVTSGISFAIGWVFLAEGLSRGRTTIVAPIESLTAVAFCAVAEGLLIGWPGYEVGAGIILGVGAAALIGIGGPEQGSSALPVRYSVGMGAAAGLCFGLSYLALGFVSATAGIVALVTMRFFAAAGALAWLAVERHRVPAAPLEPNASSLMQGRAFAVAGGICDGLGTFAFILATVNALVGVSVAILSLYAAVTVLLGVILLNERPSQAQVAGLAMAAFAIFVLTSLA